MPTSVSTVAAAASIADGPCALPSMPAAGSVPSAMSAATGQSGA